MLAPASGAASRSCVKPVTSESAGQTAEYAAGADVADHSVAARHRRLQPRGKHVRRHAEPQQTGTERRRPAAVAAVVELERHRTAARQRRDVHAVGTALHQQARERPASGRCPRGRCRRRTTARPAWRRPPTGRGEPSGACTSDSTPRASPVTDSACCGAPQPSTTTAVTGSPAASASRASIACCSGWSRLQVARGRPAGRDAGRQHRRVLARAVHRQPLGRAAVGQPRRPSSARAAAAPAGSPRSSGPSPAAASIAGGDAPGARPRRCASPRRWPAPAPSAATSRPPAAPSPAPACSTTAAASAGRRHPPRTSPTRRRRGRPASRGAPTRRSRSARPRPGPGCPARTPWPVGGAQCRPSSASSAATSASPSR